MSLLMEETHICHGRDPCVSDGRRHWSFGVVGSSKRLDRPSVHPVSVVTMVKQTKFFRKQAQKAEQAARRALDPDRAAGLRAMALAYRSQADVLKRKKKARKTKPAE